MSNIVGPIEINDWRTMSCILRSINYYKKRNEPKFEHALETETRLYKMYKDKYVAANDNHEARVAA